jgi:hypothetical protein
MSDNNQNGEVDLSAQASNLRQRFYDDLSDAPTVFIPGEFGFRMFGKYVNPEYWGFNSVAENFKQRTDDELIFTTTGFLQSAHDAACDVFAQIFGGLADYGEHHSDCFGHDRYGNVLYPAQIDRWDSSKPIIILCHGRGAMVAQMLQYLLSIDHFQKGSDASWIKGIITINGSFNGTPLASALGIKTDGCRLLVPIYLQIFIRILVLIVWVLTRLCILPRGILDPYNSDSIYTAFRFVNSKGHNILNNKDNSLYEYEFNGAKKFQDQFVSLNEETLYLNVVSNTNVNNNRYVPCPSIFNPLRPLTNLIISRYGTPCEFRETLPVVRRFNPKYYYLNDGLTSMASQTYPYLANTRDGSIEEDVLSKFRSQEISTLQMHRNYLKLKCQIDRLINGEDLDQPVDSRPPIFDDETPESERTSNFYDHDIPLELIKLFEKGYYHYLVSSTRPDTGNYGLSTVPSQVSSALLYPDFRDRVALYRALIDYTRLYCKFEGLQSKIAIAEELEKIRQEEKNTRLAIDLRTLQKTCNTNSKVEVLYIERACEIIDITDIEDQIEALKETNIPVEKVEELDRQLSALKLQILLFEQGSKSNVTLLLEIMNSKAELQDLIDSCQPPTTTVGP